MSWTGSVANYLGVAEEGLRLILGQLAGYPFFLLHSYYLKKSPAQVQHLYFALTGIAVAYWSIGQECLMHSLICILVTYVTVNIFRGSFISTAFIFVFQMVYLGAGYYFKATSDYDINWTMPHCVLCLRLIGLAMDVHDGTKEEAQLARDQKEAFLKDPPSLLEMLSHSFFIGGYFVGPQFSMRKFTNFIKRNIEEDLPTSVRFGFKRCLIGGAYLTFHLVGDSFVPSNFVESVEFASMTFFKRSLYFSIWVKIILAKYIAAWLFAEGAVILSGLAYNGTWDDGKIKWNGGANVRLRIFEKSSRFQHLIDSFNINTNAWVMSYVYKRLRFLNNRLLSQLGALAFLSLWHGWHSGYYITFFNEFLVINFEKDFFYMVDNSPMMKKLFENRLFANFSWVLGKVYLTFFLPHCFLPFALLKSHKYLPVLMTTYAGVYVFFGTWPLWKPLAKMVLKPQQPEKKEN